MTISDMHIAWKLELDKSSALELPSFEPEEIDYWINRGIRQFVKTRISGSMTGKGFEMNMKRIEDLKTLIVTASFEDPDLLSYADYGDTNKHEDSYIVDISSITDTKWYTLNEDVTISYTSISGDTETKWQGITQCTMDTYYSHLNDPYSEHRLHYEEAKPLRLMESDTVELTTDGNYSITKYRIKYIELPQEVSYSDDIDCNLPEHTHDEIVTLAVNMALENIEQPRYQTHQYELNKIE